MWGGWTIVLPHRRNQTKIKWLWTWNFQLFCDDEKWTNLTRTSSKKNNNNNNNNNKKKSLKVLNARVVSNLVSKIYIYKFV